MRIRDIPSHIKWAWQRLTRGWDDRAWWSIDSYLCQMLPAWLRKLGENSYPMRLTPGEWDVVLEEMAQGFEAGGRLANGDSEPGDEEKFSRAMDLFREWFFDLWD